MSSVEKASPASEIEEAASVGDAALSAGNGNPSRNRKRGVPEGLWVRCDGRGAAVFKKMVDEKMGVCPERDCGHHFYVPARRRIEQLLDADSFEEWYTDLAPLDPLSFADKRPYRDRLKEEQAKTGLVEACIVGRGY